MTVGREYSSGPNVYWTENDLVFIRLKDEAIAIIDAADAALVLPLRWTIRQRPGCTAYAYHHWNRRGQKGAIALHRFIMAPPIDKVIDHRDGNGLNNRRSNLRVCEHKDNAKNRRKVAGANRFKGVHPKRGRFEVYLRNDSSQRFIGAYRDEITAALAYDIAATIAHGEFSAPNFNPKRDWLFPTADYEALARLRAAAPGGPMAGLGSDHRRHDLSGRPDAAALGRDAAGEELADHHHKTLRNQR